MKAKPLLTWISANALGLGVGFVASLQTGMLIEFGFDTEMHWNFTPPPGQSDYAARLVALLVGGTMLGWAQALVLRSRAVLVLPWILSTAAGFGVLVIAVIWPLMWADLWGRFPGPVEPIIILVGGGSLAGVFQYLSLRREGIVASRWLALWVGGLVASLVPAALLFTLLEGPLGLSLSWPVQTLLSGSVVAGVAAMISGKALFAALSRRPEQFDRPGPVSAGAV